MEQLFEAIAAGWAASVTRGSLGRSFEIEWFTTKPDNDSQLRLVELGNAGIGTPYPRMDARLAGRLDQ